MLQRIKLFHKKVVYEKETKKIRVLLVFYREWQHHLLGGKTKSVQWTEIKENKKILELTCDNQQIYSLNKEDNYGMMVRVFANDPGNLGSIPGRVIPKTQK